MLILIPPDLLKGEKRNNINRYGDTLYLQI